MAFAHHWITREAGTTSEIINVFFRDTRNVSTVGFPNISASSIAFSWCRTDQASQSSGVCSSNTVIGTYSTNALTQISSTSTLGWYQFGAMDGLFASGRSAVLHLWSRSSTAGVDRVNVEIDIQGNTGAVRVSTMATQVGVSTLAASVSSVTGAVHVSSAGVNFGVSTLATSVSSVTGSVNVSSYSRDVGVSTIAVSEKLVGVSTIAAAQKLVGVSTMTTPAGVSSASVNLGVSTLATAVEVSTMSTPVGVSSASVELGVSTLATSVDVSSSIMVSSNIVQVLGAAIDGDGSDGNPWGPV